MMDWNYREQLRIADQGRRIQRCEIVLISIPRVEMTLAAAEFRRSARRRPALIESADLAALRFFNFIQNTAKQDTGFKAWSLRRNLADSPYSPRKEPPMSLQARRDTSDVGSAFHRSIR
jgi:hypothetical protein